MKNIRILCENFQFLVVKFSIYLNNRVFVMKIHFVLCAHFKKQKPLALCFGLDIYDPVNTVYVMSIRSVNLFTLFLDRLGSIGDKPVLEHHIL